MILNGQTSSWRPVLAGVPQGSSLGPLLFLVYIGDLPSELKSNATLFADDTTCLAIVEDKNESANILSDHLQLISKWALNWKMLLFNWKCFYSGTPAQEVLFSRKKTNTKSSNHELIKQCLS